jgi:UDP-3-O-[3-hydroxymyristoyl] N-acetylglucosamine deacetylase
MDLQRTIQQKVKVAGVGLHTGEPCHLTFCPAPDNTGILFVRADLPGRPALAVSANQVQATQMATVLGGQSFSVSTVEHCLSSLAALRIDNLIIELSGPEIPIVDGSAYPFFEAIVSAGLQEQQTPRTYAYISQPVYYGEPEKHAYITPYNGLRITCTIDFQHPSIGLQTLDIEINESTFVQEIARARTFGFMKDAEALRAKGLALGANLENTIVLDHQGILNPGGLRWADEFVRHKVLDALGDLVTLGYPLLGHVVLYKAGHDVMNHLVRQVLSHPDHYRLIELAVPFTSNDLQQQNFASFRWAHV